MLNLSYFHQVAHALHGIGLGRAARLVTGISRILFAAQVPAETKIGPGTVFGYGGIGVVVHRDAVIGANVLISPGVVIGGRSGLAGVPVIEDGLAIVEAQSRTVRLLIRSNWRTGRDWRLPRPERLCRSHDGWLACLVALLPCCT